MPPPVLMVRGTRAHAAAHQGRQDLRTDLGKIAPVTPEENQRATRLLMNWVHRCRTGQVPDVVVPEMEEILWLVNVLDLDLAGARNHPGK